MAKEKQDADDHENEEQVAEVFADEEHGDDKDRKEEYLGFRRKMDEFKSAQDGMMSESENFKKQGNAYFTFGCYSQATIMYSEALELAPHSHVLYCNRAMAYLKQEMADLALADAEKSLEIEGSIDNIKAYWRKSQALLDLKKYEEAEVAASAGLELHGRNPHLNKVLRKAREASVVDKLLGWEWVGKLENGIEQRLAFSKEGEMTMSVFGHSLTSTYELSVEGNPRSMVVRMKHEVTPGQPPPPPMVYIFEFQDGDEELWLCHPIDGGKDLPTKFEGAGFVKHKRTTPLKPLTDDGYADSGETEDVRCARYMQKMIKVLPLVPPQLPEKPSDAQIKDEIEITGRVSELKRKYGLEVHRRVVEFTKSPKTAESEEMQELAQQLRRRFLARKLLTEEPKAKVPPQQPAAVAAVVPPAVSAASAAPPAAADNLKMGGPEERELELPAGLALLPAQGEIKAVPSFLSSLASCLPCGKNS